MIRSFLFLSLLSLALLSTSNGMDDKARRLRLFEECPEQETESEEELLKFENVKFRAQYSKDWIKEENNLGDLWLYCDTFPDSVSRDIRINAAAYSNYVWDQGTHTKTVRYVEGKYLGYKAIFFVDNWRKYDPSDGSSYWRCELRFRTSDTQYTVIFGKRHAKNEEPSWCEFRDIVESLEVN